MIYTLVLLASLALILASAEFFTNGVEWLGKKLHLSEGAVGSVLAAVGTAMPETMIPIIAILLGRSEAAEEIGIGAILGAPFMLSTLALFITGLAAMSFKHEGHYRRFMFIDNHVMSRDLAFFLLVYTLAIGTAFLRNHLLKSIIALALVTAYSVYLYQTLTRGKKMEESELAPLYFARRAADPPTAVVLIQVFLALGGIVGGARLFVDSVDHLAGLLGIPPFILSLIIAPVATELPEKFNSIIWIRHGKDTLALGNITGAMVFQSSVIPALGIALTPWELNRTAIISAVLALVSAGLVYLTLRQKEQLSPGLLVGGGFFYSIFIVAVIADAVQSYWLYTVIPVAGFLVLGIVMAYNRRLRLLYGEEPGKQLTSA